MAELTDQEMNDHMDDYEEQVSVSKDNELSPGSRPEPWRLIVVTPLFQRDFFCVDVLLVTPCSLHSFTRVTGTGYPLRSSSTS